MSCECHLNTPPKSPIKSFAVSFAAITAMIGIDLPICHRATNLVSLTVSTALSQISSLLNPDNKGIIKEQITTSIVHDNMHNLFSHISEHEHNHHKHSNFIDDLSDILIELSAELLIGITISQFLPSQVIKFAHNFDLMHLIPGWSELEKNAPIVADGHAVAELLLYTTATLGPVYDVVYRQISALDLKSHYMEEVYNPLSATYEETANCFKDLNQCYDNVIDYLGITHIEH